MSLHHYFCTTAENTEKLVSSFINNNNNINTINHLHINRNKASNLDTVYVNIYTRETKDANINKSPVAESFSLEISPSLKVNVINEKEHKL